MSDLKKTTVKRHSRRGGGIYHTPTPTPLSPVSSTSLAVWGNGETHSQEQHTVGIHKISTACRKRNCGLQRTARMLYCEASMRVCATLMSGCRRQQQQQQPSCCHSPAGGSTQRCCLLLRLPASCVGDRLLISMSQRQQSGRLCQCHGNQSYP